MNYQQSTDYEEITDLVKRENQISQENLTDFFATLNCGFSWCHRAQWEGDNPQTPRVKEVRTLDSGAGEIAWW